MADNYLQFSEVIPNLTEPEEAWLKEQLQTVRVFGEQGVCRRRRARRTGRHGAGLVRHSFSPRQGRLRSDVGLSGFRLRFP